MPADSQRSRNPEKRAELGGHEENAVSSSNHADYQVRYPKLRKKIDSLPIQKKDSALKCAPGGESLLLRCGKINDPQGEENLEVNLKRLQGPTYRWT